MIYGSTAICFVPGFSRTDGRMPGETSEFETDLSPERRDFYELFRAVR